jgi:hypothetical protein
VSIELIETEGGATAQAGPSTLMRMEVPALNTEWPGQGGVYAGIRRGTGGAPDAHIIIGIDPACAFEDTEWGERGQDVPGAASKSDGLENTRAMAEAGSVIAQKVLGLRVGGHDDWHIGSQADMHIAFANCAEQFEADDWYWTSTNASRGYAFVQDFAGGNSDWSDKGNELRVRAFRTIPLQPLTT